MIRDLATGLAIGAAWGLILGAVGFLMLNCSARAQEFPHPSPNFTPKPEKRMSLAPGDADCFAYVLVEDRPGPYNEDETLMADRGEVVVRYVTSPEHRAPDSFEVLSLPSDTAAHPMFGDTVPNDVVRICLMEWKGL